MGKDTERRLRPPTSTPPRRHLQPGEAIDEALAPNAKRDPEDGTHGFPRVWLFDREGRFELDDAFYCPRSAQAVPPEHLWCTPCFGYKGALALHGGGEAFARFGTCRSLLASGGGHVR